LGKAEPVGPSLDGAALLDALPVLGLSLREAPGELLRKLFEVTSLAVRVQPGGERVEITIRMPADHSAVVAGAVEGIKEVASTCENPACGPGLRGYSYRCCTCPRGDSDSIQKSG
jgi:hypothetical protein